jgi:hypothetical protein
MVSLSIEDLAVNPDDSTKIPNHFKNLCEGRKLRAIAPTTTPQISMKPRISWNYPSTTPTPATMS